MKFDDLLKELDSLNLPIGEYAITSSGPLGVRGVREVHDLDILVTEALWKTLISKYGVSGDKSLKIGNIDFICHRMFEKDSIGPSILEQIAEVEFIKGHPFVKLEAIKFFKSVSEREKDKEDLILITNFEKRK